MYPIPLVHIVQFLYLIYKITYNIIISNGKRNDMFQAAEKYQQQQQPKEKSMRENGKGIFFR